MKNRSSKKGFSLMEMILAMALLTVISILFMQFMLFALNMASKAAAKTDDSFNTSGAVSGHHTASAGLPSTDTATIEINFGSDTIVIDGFAGLETGDNENYDFFIHD